MLEIIGCFCFTSVVLFTFPLLNTVYTHILLLTHLLFFSFFLKWKRRVKGSIYVLLILSSSFLILLACDHCMIWSTEGYLFYITAMYYLNNLDTYKTDLIREAECLNKINPCLDRYSKHIQKTTLITVYILNISD